MISEKAPCGKAPSCEECPFPDCEWDGVTADDWTEAKERDAQARHAAEDGRAAQRRAYREANREKVAAQRRAYREANREKLAAQQRAYYEANREKLAAQKRAYREANREKLAAQQRAYYEANREKVAAQKRAYREANREKLALASSHKKLLDTLAAWRDKEKGLTRVVLQEVLDLASALDKEVSA